MTNSASTAVRLQLKKPLRITPKGRIREKQVISLEGLVDRQPLGGTEISVRQVLVRRPVSRRTLDLEPLLEQRHRGRSPDEGPTEDGPDGEGQGAIEVEIAEHRSKQRKHCW